MIVIFRMLMVLAICSVLAYIDGVQSADPRGDTGSQIECKEPSEIENGEIIRGKNDTYYVGDKLTIKCDGLYTLYGARSIRCNPDGQWDKNPPFCKEIECPQLPQLPNGTIQPNPLASKIHTVVNVTCDHGFMLIGSPQLNCSIDGVWFPNNMLYCKEMKCPDILKIQNGAMSPTHLEGTGSVNFTCDKGYVLVGPSSLRCTEDGHWKPNVMPSCDHNFDQVILKKDCSDQLKKESDCTMQHIFIGILAAIVVCVGSIIFIKWRGICGFGTEYQLANKGPRACHSNVTSCC